MHNSPHGFQLSPQQKHLWRLQTTDGDLPYRAQAMILIEGELNTAALDEALHKVVRRHEILRTAFHRQPGIKIPFQIVKDHGRVSVDRVDLGGDDPPAQEAKIGQLEAEERGRRLDFGQKEEGSLLLRFTLITLSVRKYILLVSLPSLCADAQTLRNLAREISRQYETSLSGGEEASGEPFQYADFSAWQNELLEAEDENAEIGKAYWRDRELGSPALILPFESKRDDEQTFTLHSALSKIDHDLSSQIQATARRFDASASDLLLACWQILLWRLTGRPDIVVSSLSDGRRYEELHDALGLYAKYLPIHTRLAADQRFGDIIRQVHESRRTAEQWQDYFTWKGAAGALLPGDALDPIGFEFAEPPAKHDAGGATFSVGRQYACIDRFRLRLASLLTEDSLSVELSYDPHLFQRENIERFIGYFATLLENVVKKQEAMIGEFPLLSDPERRSLFQWNNTKAGYPDDKCLHELFEEQAARTPEAIAVVFEDRQLTYAELNGKANQLARFLRRRGVAPDVMVGLLMERSVELIVGLLGILKAGGAYVPLSPENPAARLSLQLAQCRAPILITQGRLLAQLPEFAGEVICLDRDRALFESEKKQDLAPAAAPHHLVYVIYTSGSTGTPKGVAVSHQSLVNYASFISQRLQSKGAAGSRPLRFATVSTIGADLGNTCIFPALISGGALYILSYETTMEGARFTDYLSKNSIDVLKIVPSHLEALLTSEEKSRPLPLKHLILGGEALSWELVRRISEAAVGKCEVINHYGPTETTVGSLTYHVKEGVGSTLSSTVPIGSPIANTEVYVLDEYLNPLPVGAPGQLYIGGAGLARGYLNQPEQTAERFIRHPFSDNPEERLYKTGDLVRYLPEGHVEFLGRIDNQVKIRGFRIEPGEIEAVLAQHPSVRQSVVVVKEDVPGEKRLAAYVTAGTRAPAAAAAADELRAYLREKLPDYMVPSAIVMLRALPLTPNGKVDRRALSSCDEARAELEKAFVPPRTSSEEVLAGIFSSALKLKRVSVHDNFFELGGHSLLATQVISGVRKAFQLEVPLRSLFDLPTVAELAERIDSMRREEMARLLAKLENLSEMEAQQLLEIEKGEPGGASAITPLPGD